VGFLEDFLSNSSLSSETEEEFKMKIQTFFLLIFASNHQ